MKETAPELNSEKFKEALKLKEQQLSGNPQEKYQPGSIREFAKQANDPATGKYDAYTTGAIEATKADLKKLYEQVESNAKATFRPTLETTNPEEYKKQKELERAEEELGQAA